jgi:predicted aminopeptidase
MSEQVDAFAALEHILTGDWDRFLLRLRAAIDQRRSTDEYAAHRIAERPKKDE